MLLLGKNKRKTLVSPSAVTLATPPTFKVIICGGDRVGKSTLVETFKTEANEYRLFSNLGVNFHIREVLKGAQKYILQIWDLGGEQTWLPNVMAKYCLGAHGALVCIDLSDPGTLEKIPQWIEKILPKNVPMVLVGTKLDKVPDRVIPIPFAKRIVGLMERHKILQYIATSALEEFGVEEVFNELLSLILQNYKLHPSQV